VEWIVNDEVDARPPIQVGQHLLAEITVTDSVVGGESHSAIRDFAVVPLETRGLSRSHIK
jgi:hypothetical protein